MSAVRACLEKPRFQRIPGAKLEARMKVVPSGAGDVGQFAEKNQVELEELRQRREKLTVLAFAAGIGSIAGFALFSAAVVATLPPLYLLAGELQGASQRFLLMSDLVKALEDEDVAIEVGLNTEGTRNIDFFLRFLDKEYILIQIRSLGNSKIVFSEEVGALRYRKQKGGFHTWQPSPLLELAEQERWLRKHRSDLLGTSSRDKRRPIAKLLIIWDDAFTFLGDHPEHLYATMGDQKFLTIRSMGTVSIVMRGQVIDFIRAYLSSRRSQKSS